MPVARLVRVTLEAPIDQVGVLLGRLIRFGEFHPLKREGMVQDTAILLLESKANEIYSRASDLLEKGTVKVPEQGRREVEKFGAHDVGKLLRELEEYLEIIERNLSLFTEEKDRLGVTEVLLAIQEASLMVFNDLRRIFVYPPEGGRVGLEGFVPAGSLEGLRKEMGGYLLTAESVEAKNKDDDAAYVPTLLVNPRVISVFEGLTLQRGIPKYGEIDPTPVLAFVFPFFFGIMFADVGHGIVLIVLGSYLVYRTPYKVWGRLVLVLSITTTAFGLVRGSFFGVPFTSPIERFVPLPSVLSAGFTLSSIPFLLEAAILVGTFHLASGYAIAFLNQERVGNYADAFLNRLPTIVLYSFLVSFAFAVAGTGLNLSVLFTSNAPTPVFNDVLGLNIPVAETARVSLPAIIGSMVVLVAGRPLQEYLSVRNWKSAARALVDGLVEAVAKPFEFFVNTLSYVRLAVLLITTTILGSLVAGVLAYGAFGLLLAVLLNIAVIGLEGVIVYVQDMRLQLYEWLSEFYAGTGTPFEPLVSGGPHFRVDWT